MYIGMYVHRGERVVGVDRYRRYGGFSSTRYQAVEVDLKLTQITGLPSSANATFAVVRLPYRLPRV